MATTKEHGRHRMDTGWAWVVMMGHFLIMVLMVGHFKCYGIYFVEIQQRYDVTASTTSLVGGVAAGCYSICVSVVMTCALNVITERQSVLIGAAIVTSAIVISSFAQSFIVFLICLGVFIGISSAFVYGVSFVVLGKYFHHRLTLAQAVATSGGSMGGVVMPLLIRAILDHFSFPSGLLVVGGVVGHIFISAFLFRPVDNEDIVYSVESCDQDDDGGGGDGGDCQVLTKNENDEKENSQNMSENHGGAVSCNIENENDEYNEDVGEMTPLKVCSNQDNSSRKVSSMKQDGDYSGDVTEVTPLNTCSIQHDETNASSQQVLSKDEDNNNDEHISDTTPLSLHVCGKDDAGVLVMSSNFDESDSLNKSGNKASEANDMDSGSICKRKWSSKSLEKLPGLKTLNVDNTPQTVGVSSENIHTKPNPAHSLYKNTLLTNLSTRSLQDPQHSSKSLEVLTGSSQERLKNEGDLESLENQNTGAHLDLPDSGSHLNIPTSGPHKRSFPSLAEQRNLSDSICLSVAAGGGSHCDIYHLYKDVSMAEVTLHAPDSEAGRREKGCGRFLEVSVCRRPVFWGLVVFSILGSLPCEHGLIYIPPLSREKGLTDSQGAQLVTLVSALDVVSRLVPGVIANNKLVQPQTMIIIAFLAVGVLCQFTAYFTTFEAMLGFCTVYGALAGVYYAMSAAVIIHYLGKEQFASAFGFLQLFSGASIATTFPILGALKDTTGTYAASYHFLGATGILGAILLMSLPLIQRWEQRRESGNRINKEDITS